MKKIIRLTEADLTRLVRRVIKEQGTPQDKVNASIQQKSQGKLQNIKDRIMSKFANTPPPSLEDVKVFNQVRKELASAMQPTSNDPDSLEYEAKRDRKPGEDFYFQFRPSGLYRTFSQKPEKYKLGNTMAAMFAENPEIEKLISQLPGYRPGEKYSQFDINTENMRDLLPKIKDILVKASQSGLHNYSFAQDSTPRSVVPQEIQRR